MRKLQVSSAEGCERAYDGRPVAFKQSWAVFEWREHPWRRVSVSCSEEGEEVKRKFYDGQRVRVIGADWTFRAWSLSLFPCRVWCHLRRGSKSGFWPEYLLESAE